MSNQDDKISQPKPIATGKFNNRPISEGYERTLPLKTQIEKPKLNIPSLPINQGEGDQKKKSDFKLNTKAAPYIPKSLSEKKPIQPPSSSNPSQQQIPNQLPNTYSNYQAQTPQAPQYQKPPLLQSQMGQPFFPNQQHSNYQQYQQTYYRPTMQGYQQAYAPNTMNKQQYPQGAYNQYMMQQQPPMNQQPPQQSYYNMQNNMYQPSAGFFSQRGVQQQSAMLQKSYNKAEPVTNNNTMKPTTTTQTPLNLNINAKSYVPRSFKDSLGGTNSISGTKLLNKDAKPFFPGGAKNSEEAKKKEEEEKKKEEEENEKREKEAQEKERLRLEEERELREQKEREERERIQREIEEERVRKQQQEEERIRKQQQEEERIRKQQEEERKKKPSSLGDLLGGQTIHIKDTSNYNNPRAIQKRKTTKQKSELTKKMDANKRLLTIKQQEDEERKRQKEKEEEERRRQREKEEEERKRKEKEEREKAIEEERIKREQRLREEEERKKRVIERYYFIIDKKEEGKEGKIRYTIEYILSFKDWKICKEDRLLSSDVSVHLGYLSEPEKEQSFQKKGQYNKGGYYGNNMRNSTKSKTQKDYGQQQNQQISGFNRGENAEAPQPQGGEGDMKNMEKWARKDITKEIKLAEQFKQKFDEVKSTDPVRFDITELLNVLTKDNYIEIQRKIFEIVSISTENQDKFLDVLFLKAVKEKAFVKIYAQLCKELDKELPQKAEKAVASNKAQPDKKKTSYMRSKLLERCREIFKMESNNQITNYIKADDEEEHENKLKKFILGNVNFIGELVNIQLLSKKIVDQCIDNLFKRYEKEDGLEEKLRLIALEGIVILTDKFGTLLTKQKEKIKEEDMKIFDAQLEKHLAKLDYLQENAKLPGYIKYKIINLIEKKKNGWEETEREKNIDAKSKDDVKRLYEESQKRSSTSSLSSRKGKKYDQDQVIDKIREDLHSYRDHLDDGKDKKDYGWDIITDLYQIRCNTIGEILIGFIDSCIDIVENQKSLQLANDYWNDIINFYGPIMKDFEKKEVVGIILEQLTWANNLVLDNPMLIDVWGNILISLVRNELMYLEDLNKLGEMQDEDIKSLCQIFKKMIETNKDYEEQIKQLKIVKENNDYYDEAMGLDE